MHQTDILERSNGVVKRRERILIAVFAAASSGCATAPHNPVLDSYPAGVIGHTSLMYYDVHGRTFDELRADMRRLGPKIADSNFVGETRSPMRWSWRTESSNGICSIRDVNVSVNAQVTLPRWTPPPDTEPGLVAEWNRFLNALEVHEAGHKDISAKAGSEIVTRLRGLSGLCSQMSTRANDVARVIVDRANEEQRTYDAITRHGLTQGTAFGAGRFRSSVLNASAPLTLVTPPRPGTVRGVLPATVERAWTALPAAYARAGLTINARDSVARAVGDSLTVHGTLGRLPMSDLLDCGAPPSGRNADSLDISLFVTSRLDAGPPAGSWLTNTVQAIARPKGAAPIACRSLGVIERQLFEMAHARLSAAPH